MTLVVGSMEWLFQGLEHCSHGDSGVSKMESEVIVSEGEWLKLLLKTFLSLLSEKASLPIIRQFITPFVQQIRDLFSSNMQMHENLFVQKKKKTHQDLFVTWRIHHQEKIFIGMAYISLTSLLQLCKYSSLQFHLWLETRHRQQTPYTDQGTEQALGHSPASLLCLFSPAIWEQVPNGQNLSIVWNSGVYQSHWHSHFKE